MDHPSNSVFWYFFPLLLHLARCSSFDNISCQARWYISVIPHLVDWGRRVQSFRPYWTTQQVWGPYTKTLSWKTKQSKAKQTINKKPKENIRVNHLIWFAVLAQNNSFSLVERQILHIPSRIYCLRNLAASHQRLTPVILATQEAEIRRLMVWGQPAQVVRESYLEKTCYKKKKGRGSRCRPWVQKSTTAKKKKKETFLSSFCLQVKNSHDGCG
jgi:hypothetical protein